VQEKFMNMWGLLLCIFSKVCITIRASYKKIVMYTVAAEYDQFKEELITLDTDYVQLE
jgi:hypothetical protein